MKWLNLFNDKAHKERMAKYNAEYAEIMRQQSRLEAAYNLHKEVLYAYGFHYLKHLPSPDEIIKDTKAITIINYLDI